MVDKRTFGALMTILMVPLLASAQPKFIGIGDLPGGSFRSQAIGVSADGHSVVGTSRGVSDRTQAILWTDPEFGGVGMIGLGYFPHAWPLAEAFAVNADATVVVGWSQAEFGREAFRWTDPARGGIGMIGLGELPGYQGTTFFESFAFDVSDDGQVIVGVAGAGRLAYVWTNPDRGGEGMVELVPPSGRHGSSATAVTRDGDIVVGRARSIRGHHPFRWHDPAKGGNGWVLLDLAPSNPEPWGEAYGVSDDGSVIVGMFKPFQFFERRKGFRWEDPAVGGNGLTTFEPPPNAHHARAVAVNGDGSVVIGLLEVSGPNVPFYWTDPDKGGTGMVPLVELLTLTYGFDLSDWVIDNATDISSDGRTIVGLGSNSRGGEGWLARIELPCYADCDKSTGFRNLDIFDFLCFQNRFVLGESFACNCDTSTGTGVCDVFDFICFQDSFVSGCP